MIIIYGALDNRGGFFVLRWNKDRYDDLFPAESVKVFQVKRIIQDLIYIRFQFLRFSNFELNAEDYSIEKKDYIYALP